MNGNAINSINQKCIGNNLFYQIAHLNVCDKIYNNQLLE